MAQGSNNTTLALTPADLDTRQAVPRAPDLGDVYFSADDGLAESRHVFIDGNRLPARLSAWTATRAFAIGETGFGTGRNFLVARQTFERLAPADARLHYIAIEGQPLTADELRQLWVDHEALGVPAQNLIARWPPAMRGTHRLRVSKRVTLDLIFEDIEPGLAGLDGRVDAWFLDGFAPARNPAMWSQTVFHRLAAASRSGATLATYSCARLVRDHAEAAGFHWQKRPGAGRKRDMLHGWLPAGHEMPTIGTARQRRPWFQPPITTVPAAPTRIAIIGAGIAGTTLAEALARRGQACDVFDPHDGPGGASGNAQGALHIRPAADATPRTRFYLTALAYVQRWLDSLDPGRRLWSDCGLLQLAGDDTEAARQQRCLDRLGLPQTLVHGVDQAEAARLANLSLADAIPGGLFYPRAGWVRPRALCRHLLTASAATVHATRVTQLDKTPHGWRVDCADGRQAHYDQVVLACAGQAAALWPTLPPLIPARGQLSGFAAEGAQPGPACVIGGRGYAMPPCDGRLHIGASFIPACEDATLDPTEDQANIHQLAQIAPDLAARLGQPDHSRAAIRYTSHDRLPYVGPVPDTIAWRRDYAELGLDANRIANIPGRHQVGLWANLAHGANGLVSAPLAAELLASSLLGEPRPLATDLVDALHPGRWLIRALIQGKD